MITRSVRVGLLCWMCISAIACEPDSTPQTGSQTNWLRTCSNSVECGNLSCHCGVCTHPCDTASSCGDVAGTTCVASNDTGAVALCGGSQPAPVALCLASCGGGVCADGQACVAGICRPLGTANAHLSVNLETRFQELTGFGATLAYIETEVAQSVKQPALADAMFADLGLDVLRLRNRFGYTGDDNLSSTKAIVSAATSSLGHRPTIVLASWSPPPVLKANRSTLCYGDQDTCTMTRSAAGGFDYAAYAAYWSESLAAYSAVGAAPDYIGIQNNPDYVPSAIEPGEGCRFLPTQGQATVLTSSGPRMLAFPGFAQALAAVQARLKTLGNAPKVIAPEVSSLHLLSQYMDQLGSAHFDAIGHHLYGSAPRAPNVPALRKANALGQALGRPVFQTEMHADGLGTAVLLHHTLVTEGASAYLHNALVAPLTAVQAGFAPLIALESNRFSLQPPYHALKHYAAHTDPGWVRVAAESDHDQLLGSAWVSPNGKQLTIVLVNAGADPLEVELGLGGTSVSSSRVTRTTFEADERSAELGPLPSANAVQLPPRSVVTVDIAR